MSANIMNTISSFFILIYPLVPILTKFIQHA